MTELLMFASVIPVFDALFASLKPVTSQSSSLKTSKYKSMTTSEQAYYGQNLHIYVELRGHVGFDRMCSVGYWACEQRRQLSSLLAVVFFIKATYNGI